MDKTREQQIIESLHHRLQRHHYTCTLDEVELGLNMLALKSGESKQNTALYLYWLLREGGHELLPEMFINQVSKRRPLE
jgi:hypothetical protein